ncbi:MAG: GNAT family N-acetyltransferase [Chitinophagaceae bacterium]
MIPHDLILETSKVILRPLTGEDYDTILDIATQDEDMWYYFSFNLGDKEQLKRWMEIAFNDKKAETRRPFIIVEKSTGLVAGSSSMGNISYNDKRLEIGWSWLGTKFRSTGINRHAKYSMMKYAFDELNFERVEFKTDVENARARKGLQNVGGIEEGILRSHMQMWNNRRRTSIYYSVLKNEWPGLKQTIFSDIQ